MKTLISSILVAISLMVPVTTLAWDGYDYDTGSYIDVETYDHQGRGEGEVEYYDYDTGEYKSGYMDVEPGGGATIYDYDTGETRDVDMD